MPSKSKKTRVVYGVVFDGEGDASAVFALRDEAERLAALREALRTATTWGELRALVDPGSYDEAVEHCGAFYESLEEFCQMSGLDAAAPDARREFEALAVGQREPLDADRFERQQIRALVDGDWPARLEASTADWMPATVLARFATLEASMGGGAGHTFDPADRGKIARELRRHDFTVTRQDEMVAAATRV